MKRDYENMLTFEREVFDKLVKSFEDADKEVSKIFSVNRPKEKNTNRLVMFNQEVEQFVDMNGNLLGPFAAGELANMDNSISNILVTGGKASYVDEE
jgi:hypothetical protein